MMTRTTIDIDSTVLRAIKRLARESGRTIGEVASELLARALRTTSEPGHKLVWKSGRMRARVDLDDKGAVYRAVDER